MEQTQTERILSTLEGVGREEHPRQDPVCATPVVTWRPTMTGEPVPHGDRTHPTVMSSSVVFRVVIVGHGVLEDLNTINPETSRVCEEQVVVLEVEPYV